MSPAVQSELWFITGSQHLYGAQTLAEVKDHAIKLTEGLQASPLLSISVRFIAVVTDTPEIKRVLNQANQSPSCVGVITWMHTFSPAKMWINGLKILQKPLLHLHTQFNRDIPWSSIDMDFMNLNQSAHGDREFGFITSRMRLPRKVVVGYWQSPAVHKEIDDWARACAGWNDWQDAKFVRFGDNMRQVAVTEGDKVEAEIRFGFSVNTHGVGDLVEAISQVTEDEIQVLLEEYEERYTLAPELAPGGTWRNSLLEAARIELGLEQFLKAGNFNGFTNTFEDLHGMHQLPGIAVQRLMAKGYGYAGEGDWKTAALVRAMKVMGKGLPGANAFMEDYTYHFDPENSLVLGSHMLEVDESLASHKPSLEIHPLGIGGKADPVRLVFNAAGGKGLNASLVDMGNRFRMVINEVIAVDPENELPKLPVARVLWKPLPDMETACKAWILAGGAHHTCFSSNLSTEILMDFAEIAGVEALVIDKDTRIRDFRKEIHWNDMAFRK
ncbi:L-arabinose isomerase [Lunatimonas lonarensis]|uniref:L-arabinose isomerase n=1 Tax=Lunatimonas lonarensis TaxID=1232681 RepID=R7ZV26_9BACT|nr:L-arabinose isomerase [Lunatimonas lonarensis]EON77990.1 L-arabinose isomerase [Lunatimonas lonarensis]